MVGICAVVTAILTVLTSPTAASVQSVGELELNWKQKHLIFLLKILPVTIATHIISE